MNFYFVIKENIEYKLMHRCGEFSYWKADLGEYQQALENLLNCNEPGLTDDTKFKLIDKILKLNLKPPKPKSSFYVANATYNHEYSSEEKRLLAEAKFATIEKQLNQF
jgi:hypothetical protein